MAKEKKDILKMYAARPQNDFMDTGIDCLNELWGGGVCPGAMYSMWGAPGAGKSTVTSQIMKSFLRNGKKVLLVDSEKAMNDNQQVAFGLKKYADDGSFIRLVCNNYDELQDIVEGAPSLGISLFVLDSETELVPAISREMRVTDSQPGIKAKQSSFILTLMKNMFYSNSIGSIVLFHERANLSMTGFNGPDSKQAGGFAAKHIPDVITHLIPHGRVMDGDQRIGVDLELTTDKNKFAPPFVSIRKKLIFGDRKSTRLNSSH